VAGLNQKHLALLRRHRPALARFVRSTKMQIEQIAFVVADRASKLGQATTDAGVIVTERASVVLPVTMAAVPALQAAAGASEVQQLVSEHGAVPVIVIDGDDVAAVSFCQVGPRFDASVSNPLSDPDEATSG